MKKKLIIVGGGISGLICSYAFRYKNTFDVTILEPDDIGGEFLASGMRYVGAKKADELDPVKKMLEQLDLAYTDYLVKPGVFLRDKVHTYPLDTKEFSSGEVNRIKFDYYRKSRMAYPGNDIKSAMNDPANYRSKRAFKFNLRDFVIALRNRAKIIKIKALMITNSNVICSDSVKIPYDYLVLTVPLWDIKKMVRWTVHTGDAVKLNSALITTDNQEFIQWDYVYTPYTPSDCIHKVISAGCGYVVECSGRMNDADFHSDLEFLFNGDWNIRNYFTGLKGYMVSKPEAKTKYPENVAPLGRFATWNQDSTVDTLLEEARGLARLWR